jgi:hypothetical protein
MRGPDTSPGQHSPAGAPRIRGAGAFPPEHPKPGARLAALSAKLLTAGNACRTVLGVAGSACDYRRRGYVSCRYRDNPPLADECDLRAEEAPMGLASSPVTRRINVAFDEWIEAECLATRNVWQRSVTH